MVLYCLIAKDQGLPVRCVSLEFLQFREFFGVVTWRDISSSLSLDRRGGSRLVYYSSTFFCAWSLLRSHFCLLLSSFLYSFHDTHDETGPVTNRD